MKALTTSEKSLIEGYAAALQDIMKEITGANDCAKSYDPLTVSDDGKIMHSYAFDMKDGGRHHMVTQYKTVEDIKKTLLNEAVKEIQQCSGQEL